ncbi:MAG TPA: biotin--[acetyl-CoA-carboxylase] ligase [Lacisediminihabitans sp.]|uniref:biotin--[acetyl-CoA-carboxylase] ligase n=1 Tax=Lacisediminihabitans sp. TaxID=2787631 RepID=UPI002ED8AA45
MHLPISVAAAARLEILDEARSTNTELVGRASGLDGEDWPDFSVLVTDNQTDGRGRLGRVWVAPPGRSLAISVLLRPRLPAGEPLGLEHYGWLPLIAGIAMTKAVAGLLADHTVTLKWPNDVQVDGLKVAGLLAELLPSGEAVVMGAGLNLAFPAEELPTPTSTSLGLNGPRRGGIALAGEALADAALSRYLVELRSLSSEFLRYGADPAASGVSEQLSELCSTLGQEVRVQLPGGDDLVGTAVDIDPTGRLLVRRSSDGAVVAVAAGDVTHLRYE